MSISTNAHEQALLDVERRFWNALKEKDADAASTLTDEQCVIVGAQGISAIDAKTMATMTSDAPWKLEHYELDEQARQVRFLTDDIAIVAYPVRERVVVDGETVPVVANDSSVWVRRDGRWRCALHTESLAGDPFGRDKTPRVSG